MGQSIQQAFQQLRRNPTHSAAVIAIMSLCIGSCVAIFGMVKAVLLTDWMYADVERLAVIWHARPNVPGNLGMSPSDVASYRSGLTTFDGVAAVTTRGFNLGGGAAPSRVTCARMTAEMFPLLGVAPRQGRWFTVAEDRDASPVIVVSHRLWQSQLGADPAAVDGEIVLDGIARRVLAVMPEAFAFPPEGIQGLDAADCWIPASYTPAELAIPSFSHVVVGRLKADATWAQAGADAHAGAQRIWATYPAAVQSQIQLTARVVPLVEQAIGRAWMPLALFGGSVISLLLIGCANASNLMLASFDRRKQDIAVRMSLGASRASVITQLLVESLMLATAGGLLGAAIARGLLTAMVVTNAAAFPRLADARIDVAALGFAVLCGLIAGILGGLPPALAAADPNAVHHERTRVVARGFAGTVWRRGLIAFELALAVVVLVLAGVLARSVIALNEVDTGLDDRGVISFSVALPEVSYRRPDQIAAFRDRVLEQLDRVPGVGERAVSSALPVGAAQPAVVLPEGSVSPTDYRPAAIYSVTEDFATTLAMRVTAGRFFDKTDAPTARVAVLNATLARSLWPAGDVVGRSISLVGEAAPLTIVGVVGDVRQGGPQRPAAPAIYRLLSQTDQRVSNLHFVVHSDLPLARLGDGLRRAVAGVDPEIPVFALRTLTDSIAATMAVQRFNMLVVGVFAAFAIVLALSGLYAVLAHAVERARRDFGIRQALGATRARIIRGVLSQAWWPAVIGIGGGVIAAMAASELIASLLFGVRPNDPATIGAVVVGILTASLIAVLAPALRAARVDPAALLRHD
jgi:putative ABC transport system permease protein